MIHFTNILNNDTKGLSVDNLVNLRRAKMIELGLDVNSINWVHYKLVLKAKIELNKNN